MSAQPASPGPRQTAEDRRAQVVEAAIREFAEQGFHAASTSGIARRAGISQPYIYALFPSKQALFLAAHDRVMARVRATFEAAAQGATSPEDALERIGATYEGLIGDRCTLLCQLQAYAASGDEEVRAHVAAEFRALYDRIIELSGATPLQVTQFVAHGMLASVTTILDLPSIWEPLRGEKC